MPLPEPVVRQVIAGALETVALEPPADLESEISDFKSKTAGQGHRRAGSEDRSARENGRRIGRPTDGLGGPSYGSTRGATGGRSRAGDGRRVAIAARLAAGDRYARCKENSNAARRAAAARACATAAARRKAKRRSSAPPLARGPPAPGRQLELQPSGRRLPALLHPSRQRGQHDGGHRLGPAALPRRRLHAQGGRVPGRRAARAGLLEEPRHQDLLRQRPPRRLDVRPRPGHDRLVRGLRHDPRSRI